MWQINLFAIIENERMRVQIVDTVQLFSPKCTTNQTIMKLLKNGSVVIEMGYSCHGHGPQIVILFPHQISYKEKDSTQPAQTLITKVFKEQDFTGCPIVQFPY
jgi:carbamate kinase